MRPNDLPIQDEEFTTDQVSSIFYADDSIDEEKVIDDGLLHGDDLIADFKKWRERNEG